MSNLTKKKIKIKIIYGYIKFHKDISCFTIHIYIYNGLYLILTYFIVSNWMPFIIVIPLCLYIFLLKIYYLL